MIFTFIFSTLALAAGLGTLALLLFKVLGYINGPPRFGGFKGYALLGLGLTVLAATGVFGVEYIWSNTEIVTVHPRPPEYNITLARNDSDPYEGDVVRFTGQLTVDGQPVSGATVDLYYNNTGFVVGVLTNASGHYTADWTAPTVTTATVYNFSARYGKP